MPVYEYQKGGKKWYYYAFEVKERDGSRKTIKKRGFKGSTEAKRAEEEARVAWNKGSHIDPKKVSFGEYITDWLKNKQDVSEQSRNTYEGYLKLHIVPFLGSIPLQKVTADDITDFVKCLQEKETAPPGPIGKKKREPRPPKKLADGSIKKIYNVVNTCLQSAVRKEHIFRNPTILLSKEDRPQSKKPSMDYWSSDEVKKFLNGFEHRQKIIFILAIYCGMRQGEILGLDRDKDIDLINGIIHIRQILAFRKKLKSGAKTDSGNRSISIPPFVVEAIKKHRKKVLEEKLAAEDYEDQGLLICTQTGRPLGRENCRKMWTLLLKKTGVRKIRFHDLRHTCASLLFQTDPPAHPKVVQELLGHSSIKITLDLYSHMIPNMHAEAVHALEKLLK